MFRRIKILFLICLLFACDSKISNQELELTPVSYSQLEGFDSDDMLSAYNAFLKSCSAVSKSNTEFLSSSKIKIRRQDYLNICAKAKEILPYNFKDFIVKNFTPYQITYKNSSTGKFTAYYEAEINASFKKDDKYRYPVYGIPYDLVRLNLKDFDSNLPNREIFGRVSDGKLVPYYTRAEITINGINAPVILWADSDIDVYIMQIQGSAVANMQDGSKLRISYAANNGHKFKGIGSILLSKGLIKSGQASMGKIKKWLKENSAVALVNMNENMRYIFHRLGSKDGAIGSQGVALTPQRSLAVDKNYIPLGAILWLQTSDSHGQKINKLVLAQDTGSAITGAIRGDYFYGSGGDEILDLAGTMNSKGTYFVLIPSSQGEQ